MLGKLHMSSLPDADLPLPRNPWNTEHITGGSSTGSGAAVAVGLCLGSLGEDTAGLDSQSVGVLRHRWAESDLRTREPAWAGAAQLVVGSLRTDGACG